LDRRLPDKKISTVTTDNAKGGRLAVEHLLAKGRKHILFISGPEQVVSSEERYQGYTQALHTAGLPVSQRLRVYGDFSYESGFAAVQSLLKDTVEIDGIFAANDLMAIGAIEALQESGFNVPEQISVVGYDDIQMASLYKPRLTTIRQPIYQMGSQAVKLIMRGIHSTRHKCDEYLCEPELVIRQSS
jgi:LacI family transcriptional regulator